MKRLLSSKNSSSSVLSASGSKRLKPECSGQSRLIDESRIRVLKSADSPASGPVIYWMARDQRVNDNWALIYAQEQAIARNQPLAVVFNLVPKFLDATIRQFGFMLRGLEKVQEKLREEFGIPFFMVKGNPEESILEFAQKLDAGLIVTDFSPLRIFQDWKRNLVENISENLPGVSVHEVDAHNIVPPWIASEKIEYAARTIRPRIQKQLDRYLVEFPPLQKMENDNFSAFKGMSTSIDWEGVRQYLDVDRTVKEVSWLTPGEDGARSVLDTFVKEKLIKYDSDRNDPTKDGISNISPYLHFGQISAQRVALQVKKSKSSKSSEAYLEELIVRRELSENYCFYNVDGYDRLDGLYPQFDNNSWAQKTLQEHRNDPRSELYSLAELEKGKTKDRLWNAAEMELVVTGKMHGFLRMYWAKKILEWTQSPEEALKFSIYLNDKYALDGRDPNGYVGCAWSIGGVHDQGWRERPVFGKIRYMNFEGCKRKFDVEAYIRKIKRLEVKYEFSDE